MYLKLIPTICDFLICSSKLAQSNAQRHLYFNLTVSTRTRVAGKNTVTKFRKRSLVNPCQIFYRSYVTRPCYCTFIFYKCMLQNYLLIQGTYGDYCSAAIREITFKNASRERINREQGRFNSKAVYIKNTMY